MAEIKAAMVKELREMTGAGMMECKKALVEANGDMDAAVDVLRKAGLAAVAKKAGRATNEGTVFAKVAEDGAMGAVVELNCETDFVGMNEKFKAYAEKVADAVLANDPADMDALKASELNGETVDAIVTDCIHVMGENTQLSRFASIKGDAVASYIHMGGKIGILVAFELGNAEVGKTDAFKAYGRDIAMQVAAAAPIAATRDEVPAETVEHEMSIYKAQAAESGKPEQIQVKIAEGRMNKFYGEFVLTEQAFVKDPDQKVADYTKKVAKELGTDIKILGFKRFVLGQAE